MESYDFTVEGAGHTKKLAGILARECLRINNLRHALVMGLVGELGAGKTAFVQGFAKALGVKEKVLSPTFVLLKIFKLRGKKFRHLLHIDAYRLNSPGELKNLGWAELVADPKNIILVEWSDKISRLLPRGSIIIKFSHLGEDSRRLHVRCK